MADSDTWESLAKKPGGDHDIEFHFGCPQMFLRPFDLAHLLVMRGLMRDVSHAPDCIRDSLRYGGDNDYLMQLESGLFVPNSR